MDPLAEYAWKKRPLVLLTDDKDNPTYRRQIEALQGHGEALAERDIAVFQVVNVGSDFAELKGVGPEGPLDADAARAIIDRFEAEEAFAVVLVGKDTTETLRSTEPVSADELLEAIDADPL